MSRPAGSKSRGRPLLAAGLVLAALAAPLPAAAASVAGTERSVLRDVNAVRAQHGLSRVQTSGPLEQAARFHSQDMVAHRYFKHGPFSERLLRFGAQGPHLGENLGWSAFPDTAPETIVRLWLQSPEHRAVLLAPGFRRVGIGVAVGAFMGYDHAAVVTADFEGT